MISCSRLQVAGDDGLLALANALGFRAEPASVQVLEKTIHRTRQGPAVTIAVARASGKIATPEASPRSRRACPYGGPVRLQVAVPWRMRQTLPPRARRPRPERSPRSSIIPTNLPAFAGLEGLLRTGGDAAATILEVLARKDALESSAAVGFVANLDSKAIKQLADGLTTLPPTAQVALLQALGARRDRAALPAVAAAAASDNLAVKTAALAALGESAIARPFPCWCRLSRRAVILPVQPGTAWKLSSQTASTRRSSIR